MVRMMMNGEECAYTEMMDGWVSRVHSSFTTYDEYEYEYESRITDKCKPNSIAALHDWIRNSL